MDENRFAKYGFIGALALASIVAGYAFLSKPPKKLNPGEPVVVEQLREGNKLEDTVNREAERTSAALETQPASKPDVETAQTQPYLRPPEELAKLLEAGYLIKQAKGPLDLYLKNVLLLWGGKFPEKAEYRPFSDGSELKAYASDAVTDLDGNPLRRVAKLHYEASDGNSLEVLIGQKRQGESRIPSSVTVNLRYASGRVNTIVIATEKGKRIETYSADGKLDSVQEVPYQHPESWQGYADLVTFVD